MSKRSILFVNPFKSNFLYILSKLSLPLDEYGYHYDGKCTDPMTSRYWVSHMSKYVFYLKHPDGKLTELKSGKTSKTHFDNEENLRKVYAFWAKQYIKNKQ